MYDLPQQPADGQVILPIEVGEKGQGVTHEGVRYEMIERPSPSESKLEEKDLYEMTHYLKAKYAKGFTWKELPEIIQELVLYIGPNPAMSLKEKRVAALETLHYLLVSIDSLYLPEKATEPFFENMIPHFIYLAFTFPKDATLVKPTRSEPFTRVELDSYADELFAHFEGELCWKNMSKAVSLALKMALSCTDCSQEEKGKTAAYIIESLLKKGDPSRLPASYDGKLFSLFIQSFISLQMMSPINGHAAE